MPNPSSGTFTITDFGAVGDGKTLCTAAIQHALDSAGKQGGGVVLIPPGRFKSSTLYLRSGVTLEIQSGAILQASERMEDYPTVPRNHGHKDRQPYHFLVLQSLEHVTIRGGGVLDGQGEAFWHPYPGPRKWYVEKNARVSPMLECTGCTDLRILDITISNSPGWTCHLRNCERVFIRGVSILNNIFGPNTDGIDVNGCKDVFISDCRIDTGDDAIVLKTDEDAGTCERVTVTNCSIRTNCVALKLGAAESFHDMRNITFSNCVVHESNRAIGLYSLEGATLENVSFSNIVCDTEGVIAFNRPIHIDLRRKRDISKMGRIRNIQISNFSAIGDGRILMTAEDGAWLENILLRDIQLVYPRIHDPEPGAPASKSVQFSNRSPDARGARGAVIADNIKNLVVEGLTIEWPEKEEGPDFPVLWGRNLQGGRLHCPLAHPNRKGAEKYKLHSCDIRMD